MKEWNDDPEFLKNARQAAAEMRTMERPSDRSLQWDVDVGGLTQEYVDDLVLQAHMVAPVWSDYALVERRPTIWELVAAVSYLSDNHLPLVADDSLVIASSSAVEMLITIGTVSSNGRVLYQISCHALVMNADSIFCFLAFREIAEFYGLASYADGALSDKLKLHVSGSGAEEYIASSERNRPVFLFRRLSQLSARVRQYQRAAHQIHSAFGAVIINDGLFKRYAHHLTNRKFGYIAVAPGGEVVPIEPSDGIEPKNFLLMLERFPLLQETETQIDTEPLGVSARNFWKAKDRILPKRPELTEVGDVLRERWRALLSPSIPPSVAAVVEQDREVVEEDRTGSRLQSPIQLDQHGYPLKASDVVRWAQREFADRIVFLPRAKRAMEKFNHPNPARLAKALSMLAGPKLDCIRGDRSAAANFEAELASLHMRDGFSNATRLRGQTGDAYIFEHDGRKLMLERHLCSNSSGFNDRKMIRIYYVYDRAADKIVVGWLPTHLPTSQS